MDELVKCIPQPGEYSDASTNSIDLDKSRDLTI